MTRWRNLIGQRRPPPCTYHFSAGFTRCDYSTRGKYPILTHLLPVNGREYTFSSMNGPHLSASARLTAPLPTVIHYTILIHADATNSLSSLYIYVCVSPFLPRATDTRYLCCLYVFIRVAAVVCLPRGELRRAAASVCVPPLKNFMPKFTFSKAVSVILPG